MPSHFLVHYLLIAFSLQIIANYEKVISTSKADEDNMVSSLKYMISTLKEKLEAANSRYDTMSDRYRFVECDLLTRLFLADNAIVAGIFLK